MLCAHDRTTIDVRCTRSVVNWKSDTAALTLRTFFAIALAVIGEPFGRG